MWLPRRMRSPARSPASEAQARPAYWRDRLAMFTAIATVVCVVAVFVFSKGTHFLMPGPLTSAHGSIETCNTCHTNSGSGKLSWLHGFVAGDRLADSKACLSCHKMPDTALNAHSASADILNASTLRLMKVAAETPVPRSARAQDIAFPTQNVVARGLFCSTCHQEHQGANFKLNKISNEQCRSCHEVKFDSFDRHHPKFENYPFKRRTPIIYDHAGHFGKHFPEVAKKDPSKRIPDTCSSCHNSRDDKRVMAVAPFDQTCTGCHLGQITGKERATGPKGIAFLSVPGLDLQTLKKKNAAIGEWPDASDAALTPFMKVMISRDARGRALIKTVDKLNLQDLTTANDEQIKAVTELAWEIKQLFYALITGKASAVLGDLNIAGGAKLSASLVADLTAGIPRDAVTGAQQEWLPNLGKEMADRPVKPDQKQTGLNPAPTEPQAAGGVAGGGGKADTTNPKTDAAKDRRSANDLPPPMRAGVGDLAQANSAADEIGAGKAKSVGNDETLSVDDHGAAAIKGRTILPSGTPRDIGSRGKKKSEPETDRKSGSSTKAGDTKEQPAAGQDKDTTKSAQPDDGAGKTDTSGVKPDSDKDSSSASPPPSGDPADQKDDLLFPTQDELRGLGTDDKSAGKTAQPEADSGKADTANAKPAEPTDTSSKAGENPSRSTSQGSTAVAKPQARATPVISIDTDVDPESWAEYGGWYRLDYAIFYRPSGHKDKFIYSWLFLTGPQAPKGDRSPAAAVFDFLTGKDAQGSCTKCHSIDAIQSKGRLVNFSPPSAESKLGHFTKFIHEPHFGIMENRGCLTCHSLEKDRPYLKSYEQGNPHEFASNFSEVKKDLCQSCHASNMARQDCLTCHNYHVPGVITPIMNTKLPTQ